MKLYLSPYEKHGITKNDFHETRKCSTEKFAGMLNLTQIRQQIWRTRMEIHLYHKMFLNTPSFEKFRISERR